MLPLVKSGIIIQEQEGLQRWGLSWFGEAAEVVSWQTWSSRLMIRDRTFPNSPGRISGMMALSVCTAKKAWSCGGCPWRILEQRKDQYQSWMGHVHATAFLCLLSPTRYNLLWLILDCHSWPYAILLAHSWLYKPACHRTDLTRQDKRHLGICTNIQGSTTWKPRTIKTRNSNRRSIPRWRKAKEIARRLLECARRSGPMGERRCHNPVLALPNHPTGSFGAPETQV